MDETAGTQLADSIYAKVTEFSDLGNSYMEEGSYEKAIECFSRSLSLLPEPKNRWEAAMWLNASIGDALFLQGHFKDALGTLLDALNCPDAVTNPFIQLRLGECFYELENFARAKDHLLRAYMLEGADIFQSELPKFFDCIKQDVGAPE
ncbi:MAG TPA: tetratricopeptide repeat protein [Terriglobia bacterium]|nr:tetratricopeptide repeat protein [Terriglobia bacterium]